MNYAIAAGHDCTAQAAVEVLRAGGNAIDAAIAAYLMSWVAEPLMSSGGGGAFALVFTEKGDAKLFDFFCQTPRHKRPLPEVNFFPVEIDFGDIRETFHVGLGATAVPGAVAGVFALHQHYGSMPMKVLVQPAIQAAKDGVVVNDFQHFDFDLVKPIINLNERAKTIFCNGDQVKSVGEKIFMPQLADFLEFIAKEGQDGFYKGEIAQKIVQDYQLGGGYLTLEDFERYEVILREPLIFPYHQKTILTNPLPSIGGSIIALTMSQMKKIAAAAHHLSADHINKLHNVFEAIDALGKSPQVLEQAIFELQNKQWGSTTHFNVADRFGNVVSLSTTIGEGSGYFVENTDIQLNNMLGEAALVPEGFHSWKPNTRLSSMMAPTIVLNEKKQPEMVLGTGGASRIPFAISQVLRLLIDYQLDVATAVNSPRVHLGYNTFHVEAGFETHPPIAHFPQQVKIWQQQSLFFGGVHTLKRNGNHWTAAGDLRRSGYSFVL